MIKSSFRQVLVGELYPRWYPWFLQRLHHCYILADIRLKLFLSGINLRIWDKRPRQNPGGLTNATKAIIEHLEVSTFVRYGLAPPLYISSAFP